MKYLLITLLTMLLSAGCGSQNLDDSGSIVLSVDKTLLEFPLSGGEQNFIVTSSTSFTLLSEGSWVSADKGTKIGDKTYVKVRVSENSSEPRSARVVVSVGAESKYVEIQQKGLSNIPPQTDVTESMTALQMTQAMGLGWNLGNHFDAYNDGVAGETAWGNPLATQETFYNIKAAGFSSVRIPVTWLGKFGGAPNYRISEDWMNRVAEVVGYAEKAGLIAIINMHHDGADSNHWLDIAGAAKDDEVQKRVLAQIVAMWTQIAEKFKDKGHFLIFESFNEIHDGKWGWGANRTDGGRQYKCLNEWNQAFVDAVRATGGNNSTRFLGIPAYCTNVDIAIETFRMPEDTAKDKLMMAVHCYDPHEYTLTAKYSEWGHTADASKKYPGDNEADLKRVFVKLYDNFVSKGIAVYMGEFGCVNRETEREQAFQQYYLKYYAKLAKTYNVPCLLWDNGAKGAGNERHAFFDHGTGQYCSPEAEAAMNALISAYNDNLTLEDIYNNAPKN